MQGLSLCSLAGDTQIDLVFWGLSVCVAGENHHGLT